MSGPAWAPGERAGLRWAGSLGIVLLAHAALIAAALRWHAPREAEPPPQPASAVMVELAPLPAAPPAPPTALPPGPPRQEQRKSSPRAEPRPAPKPAPRPVPRQAYAEVAAPQAPVDTAAARQQSAEPAHPPADAAEAGENAQADAALSTAPPSVQAPPASRYAASQPSSGAASQAAATWEAQLLGHLERFKRYPRAAQRRRLEGVVLVRFAVDRQGRVLSVGIARASGHAPLDDEAVATVHRAAPLPPPPADIPGDPVEVTTPVDFFLRGR